MKQQYYVVQFSPHPPNGVGGWDWYHLRHAAKNRVMELMNEEVPYDVQFKIIEVEFDPDDEVVTDRIADSGQLDSGI